MKFIPVSPEELPNFREGRRGRVSYPLLKSFLETNLSIAMLDRTGMQNSLQALTSSLGAYIRSHGLPIKMVTRSGQIYLIRTDLDDAGNPVPFGEIPGRTTEGSTQNVQGAPYQLSPSAIGTKTIGSLQNAEPLPINAEVVKQRFEAERGKVTK